MNKSENGITIVSLVITVVVLIIVASITVYTGTGVIKQATLQTINTNMMLIQAKTKTIAEQAKFNNDTSNYKGILVSDISGDKNIDKLVNEGIIEDTSKCYMLTEEDLSNMGLEKISIDEGYIVNYDTEDIIYVKGVEKDGKTYYKLSELKELHISEEESI